MGTGDDPLGWTGATIDGRYAIDAVVGEGGFGVVYRARHLGFDEPVAVKCLKIPAVLDAAARASFVGAFREEARLLHRLSRRTAGIVQALDVGASSSPAGVWSPYIVMEWLRGVSLQDDIASRAGAKRTLWQAVQLLSPIADSLAFAHAERVAHLDVKPANVFLLDDGSVKLLDFGIAKVLSSNQTVSAATSRIGAFTPTHGAPEQFDAARGTPGPWTDVFALALLLYEICAGQRALVGETPLQLYVASTEARRRVILPPEPPPLGRCQDVIGRALEPDPTRRYADAGAFWTDLKRAFAESAAARMVAPSGAPTALAPEVSGTRAVNRICTVLSLDLGGHATRATDLDAEDLAELQDEWMANITASITRLGGRVERIVGDDLLGVFGAVQGGGGAAERGVRACLGARDALVTDPRALQHGVALRAGVATGRVLVAQVSGAAPPSLSGAPLRTAMQLRQEAGAGEVAVDRDTYREVAALFDVRIERSEGGKTYRILAASRDRVGLDAGSASDFCGVSTRLVGRDAELAAVASAGELVREERSARFVTVVGPPGVGKSRLAVEVSAWLEREGWVVFAAQAATIQSGTSYALAAALLRAKFHIHEDDAPEVVSAKLGDGLSTLRGNAAEPEHLRDTSRDDDTTARWLADLLVGGAENVDPELDEGRNEGTALGRRIANALAVLFRNAGSPVAIVCDDLHAADDATLDLLDELVVGLAPSPLLVFATARSDLLDRRPLWGEGQPAHVRLSMAPLTRRQLEEVVRDLLRRCDDLPADLPRRLAEHADGSPLILVETMHLLADAGVIEPRSHGPWLVHPERLGELTLPTTVQGVVQARLDRLDEASRMLLARASVTGRTFWDGLLVEIDPDPSSAPDRVRSALATLRTRGWLQARAVSAFPEQRELVFAESAVQRVAYEMLPRRERRVLHLGVARWLEARVPVDAGAAVVAEHYERAGAMQPALLAYRRAGAHSAALGRNDAALQSYERALRIDSMASVQLPEQDLAPPRDPRVSSWPQRVGLRMEIGDVLRRIGRFDDATARYDEALERVVRDERRADSEVQPSEVPAWEARLDYRVAIVAKLRGELPRARERLERAIEHAGRAGLQEERAEMWALSASLRRRDGDAEGSLHACRSGLRVCRAIRPQGSRARRAVSRLLNTLGAVYFAQGNAVRAERCHRQAARMLDEQRDPDLMSHALNNVAAILHARGDLEGARACFERTLRLTERSGDTWARTMVLANLGEVLLALGRRVPAREDLDEAARLGESIGARLDLTEIHRLLSRACGELGDWSAAVVSARRAVALVEAGGPKTYLASVLATSADVVNAASRVPAAAAEAMDLARDVQRVLEQRANELRSEDVHAWRALLGS